MDIMDMNMGGFGFSAIGTEQLGATSYTVVGVAVDNSGSVHPFKDEITACVKVVVDTLKDDKNPRRDNLLLRLTTFGRDVREKHGFKELSSCHQGDYDNAFNCNESRTALFDAAYDGINAIDKQGRTLINDMDMDANGILFVITDGCDNTSAMSAAAVGGRLEEARPTGPLAEEALESFRTVLIGVNITEPYVSQQLKSFETEGKFDQYVEINNADKATLLRLAEFVSKSISSQSQALGTGGPSQSLAF